MVWTYKNFSRHNLTRTSRNNSWKTKRVNPNDAVEHHPAQYNTRSKTCAHRFLRRTSCWRRYLGVGTPPPAIPPAIWISCWSARHSKEEGLFFKYKYWRSCARVEVPIDASVVALVVASVVALVLALVLDLVSYGKGKFNI